MKDLLPEKYLGKEQLKQLAGDLAGFKELWQPLVKHDPVQRTYQRLLYNDHSEAWLICWMPGHDTGFHDHNRSSGGVYVIQGAVLEQRLRLGSSPSANTYRAGESFSFSSVDIHRVVHTEQLPAVTLHVYSPRLSGMGAYIVDGTDGTLSRHQLSDDEELKPIDSPASDRVAA